MVRAINTRITRECYVISGCPTDQETSGHDDQCVMCHVTWSDLARDWSVRHILAFSLAATSRWWLSERHDWCHSEGKLSPIRWFGDLLTRWRHHHCTVAVCSLYTGPVTLYSAGQFSLGWSSAPVYCHTVNLVIKQPSPGRLLSTCQDPDCPVSLRDRVKGISLTSSDKRKRN